MTLKTSILLALAISLIGTAFLIWVGENKGDYCIKEKGGITIIP